MRNATMNDAHIMARAEGLHVAIGGSKGRVQSTITDLRLVGRWNECKWIYPMNDIKYLPEALECAVAWLMCREGGRL